MTRSGPFDRWNFGPRSPQGQDNPGESQAVILLRSLAAHEIVLSDDGARRRRRILPMVDSTERFNNSGRLSAQTVWRSLTQRM